MTQCKDQHTIYILREIVLFKVIPHHLIECTVYSLHRKLYSQHLAGHLGLNKRW